MVLEFDGLVAPLACPPLLEQGVEVVLLVIDGLVASPACPTLLEQGAEVVLELDGLIASPSCPTLLELGVEVVHELDGPKCRGCTWTCCCAFMSNSASEKVCIQLMSGFCTML